MIRKNSILKIFFSSKPLSYLLALLLLFTFVSLGREINRQIHLRGQLANLQSQAISLETENQKLGLRKTGERMIVIFPSDNLEQEKESNLKYFGKKISNFRAWWYQFFSKEENTEQE